MLAHNKLLDRFRKDASDIYNYSFKAINPSDYELDIIFTAKGKMLRTVFLQVSKVLVRLDSKFARLAASNPDYIDQFDIPEEMLNRVHTAIQKNIRDIAHVIRQDGIQIIRSSVSKCTFINKDEITNIKIQVVGQYARK